VSGILTPDEIEQHKSLFWDWLEKEGRGVNRHDTSTWSRDNLPPHKRFGLFKDGGIAHTKFMWSLRLHDGVRRVFSDLWKPKSPTANPDGSPADSESDLLVSYDGATANLYKPEKAENEWPHWDQDFDKHGMHCVQALVALTDSPDATYGGFSCWPRSHEVHLEYCQAGHALCKIPNWHMLTTKDKKLLKERGMHRVDVPYRAGDMVLWRSDLVHSGRAPSVNIDITHANMRMVAYVCMTPRSAIYWDPEAMLAQKRHAFYNGIQTTHWPHDQRNTEGKPVTKMDLFERPKYLPDPLWFQTDAQARLAGFLSLDYMQN
jgi:hypothetical protein